MKEGITDSLWIAINTKESVAAALTSAMKVRLEIQSKSSNATVTLKPNEAESLMEALADMLSLIRKGR